MTIEVGYHDKLKACRDAGVDLKSTKGEDVDAAYAELVKIQGADNVATEPTLEQVVAHIKEYVEYVREACKNPLVAAEVANMWWDVERPSAQISDPKQHVIETVEVDVIEAGNGEVNFKAAISLPDITAKAIGFDDNDDTIVEWVSG